SFYKRDYSKAVRLYQESAEHGSADAQYSIGVMYQHGLGVSRDYAEAEKWFRKAEAQGNAAARNALKAMQREGKV
ncbi:MAG: sel1 repeat family protein, partial [Candidatus Cryptobacteroides sp.]|nr:sel1 repeat family protein [Candidatus Cryptobacteroides sp.]